MHDETGKKISLAHNSLSVIEDDPIIRQATKSLKQQETKHLRSRSRESKATDTSERENRPQPPQLNDEDHWDHSTKDSKGNIPVSWMDRSPEDWPDSIHQLDARWLEKKTTRERIVWMEQIGDTFIFKQWIGLIFSNVSDRLGKSCILPALNLLWFNKHLNNGVTLCDSSGSNCRLKRRISLLFKVAIALNYRILVGKNHYLSPYLRRKKLSTTMATESFWSTQLRWNGNIMLLLEVVIQSGVVESPKISIHPKNLKDSKRRDHEH